MSSVNECIGSLGGSANDMPSRESRWHIINPHNNARIDENMHKARKGGWFWMYERLLDKGKAPTIEEMADYCGENRESFSSLNAFLAASFATDQKIVFPYGNKYGWGIEHRKKGKLICNVFPEKDAFTVMIRLTNSQFSALYEGMMPYSRGIIDKKYECGDGGWIQFRVTCAQQRDEIEKIVKAKLS